MRWLRCGLVAVSLLTAGRGLAMFRAADLVVVPVGAALPGLHDSNWRTDLEIVNVDTEAIDVEIVFLPTGGSSNLAWYLNMDNHLGGRSEDKFGHIDAKLKDIGAGASVVLEDVVRTTWGENLKGALLVFAFKAGSFQSTTPHGGTPKLAVVNSRTYDLGTTADSTPTTYGQGIPGIPWYFYVDPSQQAKGLNLVTFSGFREDASYRTAIGMVNISDPTTVLSVHATLVASDGTQLAEAWETLGPLAHRQWDNAAQSLFGLADGVTVAGATVSVSVASWQSTGAEPTPALIVYGSRVDNTTNDPTYLEQAFEVEFPWDCVFNGNCTSAKAFTSTPAAAHRRPLRPPQR